ncbi:MAG: hypothetical protein Q9177_006256, partial [Variospora cf. flavescens]
MQGGLTMAFGGLELILKKGSSLDVNKASFRVDMGGRKVGSGVPTIKLKRKTLANLVLKFEE